MNPDQSSDRVQVVAPIRSARPWWREWELWLLAAVVLGIYFTRLDQPSLRGEEPRRAQIGIEMLRSGDWIVPRQQGQIFFSRPPLQNWIIIGIGLLRGQVDVVAIRLPSVLSILAITLLVYGYARTILSQIGAFAAGAAICTMGEVLEQGRTGETEGLYILLLGGAILVWHWGYCRRGPSLATWCLSSFFIALATLAKGAQAPVYFAATVGLFLILTKRWRDLFTWRHLAGIGVFAAVWGAWQIPYFMEVGLDATKRMYANDVALRFTDVGWATIAAHAAIYPVRVFACLLPWSILLLAYCDADFRRQIAFARQHVLYLVIAISVALSTMFVAPTASTRYLMALYPCFAVLIGLVVEMCLKNTALRANPPAASESSRGTGDWALLWRRYLAGISIVMLVAGAAIFVASFSRLDYVSWAQPKRFAAIYLCAAVLLAAIAYLSSREIVAARTGILTVCAFLGLSYSGAVVNGLIRCSEDTPGAVAELKKRLPADQRLVSFGTVDPLFTYYYGAPVEPVDWPLSADRPVDEIEYFCFQKDSELAAKLDFPWQCVAEICCDRVHTDTPRRVVVVGRRPPGASSSMPLR